MMGTINRDLSDLSAAVDQRPETLDEKSLMEKQKVYKYDGSHSDKICSICIGELKESKDGMLCELICGHIFHLACVKDWLTKQSVKCPNCRKNLKN